MIRGLSSRQLLLAAAHGVMLLVSVLLVLLQQWVWAAASALISFGLFSGLVILTLAAMTRVNAVTRRRIQELRNDGGQESLGRAVRRLNDRYSKITGSIQAAEARMDATERRMLGTLESHRHAVEDSLDNMTRAQESKDHSA